MKEIKLYRESNGQYSTSEARQDDVSGYYVQKTDYDELRVEHYDSRAKMQDLEKENAELKLALGIAASFPVKVRAECKKRMESKLVSLDFITMLYDSANRAISESAARHLADIRADAVVKFTEHVKYNFEGIMSDDALIDFGNEYINSKLRGE